MANIQNPVISQNQIPNETDLKDCFDLFATQLMLGLNCHSIAKIQSFNTVTQTATATINYKQVYSMPHPVTKVYESKLVDYPILIDAPVICLGGGNGALTFPITKGDDCMVFFNDRNMDNWFIGSSTSGPATARMHSFSDCIVLVGLRSQNDVLVNYNGTDIELRTKDGQNKYTVGATKIAGQVGNSISFEFTADGKFSITNAGGEFLTALLAMLQQAYTVTMLGNQPLVFPPAQLAILEGFKE